MKNITFTPQYCRNNKVAIQVESEEELIKLYKYFPHMTFYQKWESMQQQHTDTVAFNTKMVEHCIKNYWQREGYEVITTKEFFKQNQSDMIPETWAIKTTQDTHTVVTDWINKNSQTGKKSYHTYPVGSFYHFPAYMFSIDKCHQGQVLESDYTEITFEQFEKHILNQSNTMNKEIIGYKFKPEFEHLKEIAEKIATSDGDFNDLPLTHYLKRNCWGTFKERLEQAGVLNLWFKPVYEAKKVMIGLNEVELNPTKRGVYINKEYYPKEEVIQLANTLADHSSQIKCLVVGCSGQLQVDLNKINEILKTFDE